jgi:Flp pilus assembly protein TadD
MMTKLSAPILIAVLLLAGCASSTPRQTQQEKARGEWNSARANVLLSLARNQYNGGNLDACRRTLDDALKLDDTSVGAHLLSARLSIEQGKLELAERQLELVRSLDEKNAEADYLSGIIFQRWQRPETALSFYTSAHEKSPAELAYLLARAEMLVAVDERGKALQVLQGQLTYFENNAYIRDAVGQLLVHEGSYEQGARILRQASILAPDDLGIREHLGLALYYARDYREAAFVLGQLLKDDRYARRSDLLFALGECRFQSNQLREARESFELAAQLQSGSPAIWLALAKTSLQLEDLPRTELSLRKAISLDAASPEAQMLQGYLRLRQNRLDESLTAFRKASALEPADSISMCMMGYVLEKLGRSAEAMACYAQALRLKPNDDLASMLMAQVQLHE